MFKIGDRVKIKDTSAHYYQCKEEGEILSLNDSDSYTYRVSFKNKYQNSYREEDLTLINNKTNMNIVQKFKELKLSEPVKSFYKKGITDVDGEPTSDGKILFRNFLWAKFGDEFKTTVVDLIEVDEK